jgi:hypothetical protein
MAMAGEGASMSGQRLSKSERKLFPDDTPDPLDKWEREALGNAAQFRFPLRDVPDLGRVSAILRHLSTRLEILSKSKDPAFMVLSHARLEVKTATERAMRKDKLKMPL